MDEFVEVGVADQIADGQLFGATAFGHRVAVYRSGDNFYAIGARCPHSGGALDEGYVKEDYVICPWHSSCFRLADGALLKGPATTGVPAFPVKIEDGKVLVGSPPPGTEPPPPSMF